MFNFGIHTILKMCVSPLEWYGMNCRTISFRKFKGNKHKDFGLCFTSSLPQGEFSNGKNVEMNLDINKTSSYPIINDSRENPRFLVPLLFSSYIHQLTCMDAFISRDSIIILGVVFLAHGSHGRVVYLSRIRIPCRNNCCLQAQQHLRGYSWITPMIRLNSPSNRKPT